jgi:hypothetical protein
MKLEEILKNYTKEELQITLSYLGLGYEEESDEEGLINDILSYSLNKTNFERILSILPEYSYNKLINEHVYDIKFNDDLKLYNDLKVYSLGFGTLNELHIADEFVEYIKNLDIEKLNKYRVKQIWLYQVITFANTFYAAYPLSILEELIKKNTKIHLSNTELKSRLLYLPESVGIEYYESNQAIVNLSYSSELEDIFKKQEQKPFYIPTYKEIVEYFNNGFITNVQYDLLVNYNKYLKKEYGNEARILIFNEVATTYKIDDQIVSKYYDISSVKSDNEWTEIITTFKKIAVNTRNVYNRGFTAYELMQRHIN